MRPFRFSVTIPSAASADEWKAVARKAEDQGFDVLVTADHLEDCSPPFLPLILAAEATTRLLVGTLVLNNDFRHPVMVAREAAALAQLTGGRFELGIGAGHARPEYESIGLGFDGARTRIARLSESLRLMRRLFGEERVDFEGDHYRVAGLRLFPRPEQAPPILVGGNGRSLLRLAAREADIVGFTGLGKTLADGQRHEPASFSAERVDERVTLVREAAGARLPKVELNCLVQRVVVTNDRRGGAERMAAAMAPLSASDVLASPFLLLGTPAQMAESLAERRERWGMTYFSTFAASMDAMAQVIAVVK